MSPKIPGTRAARRVEVKYPPPGTSPDRQAAQDEIDTQLRASMANAAMALVLEGRKPTIPAVVDRIVKNGGKLSIPHATRKVEALADARRAWEEKHGREPKWHRTPKAAKIAATASTDDLAEPSDESPTCGCGTALQLAEARLERARGELRKVRGSRDRLASENAELREQVRRLELQFIQDG